MNAKRGHPIRVSLGAVAFLLIGALLVASAISASRSDETPAHSTMSFSDLAALGVNPLNLPDADYNPLAGFSGLDAALAVVEADVIAVGGPPVVVSPDGFVDFDTSQGFPTITIDNVVLTDELGVVDNPASLDSLRSVIQSEGALTLYHSSGQYEVGERYALFLGGWNATEYSTLYGHHLSSDSPVIGFRDPLSEMVLDRIDFSIKGAPQSRLAQLKQLAVDLRQANRGGQPSDLVAAAVGMQPPGLEVAAENAPDDLYPMFDDGTADIDGLAPIELTILLPAEEQGALFALRGQKDLGWFQPNGLGYVVVTGFAPPGEEVQLLSRASGDEQTRALPLAAYGVAGNKLILPETPNGIFGVIDLSSAQRAASTTGDAFAFYDTQDEYWSAINSLESVLDAGQPGSELEAEE